MTGTAPQPEPKVEAVTELSAVNAELDENGSVVRANKVSVELTREEAEALRELLDPFDLTPESEPGIIDSKLRSALGEGETPGPYAKAFREKVCPVPEFPGIEKEES